MHSRSFKNRPLGPPRPLFRSLFCALFRFLTILKTRKTLHTYVEIMTGGPPRRGKHKKLVFSTSPQNAPESLGPLKVSIIHSRSSQNRRFGRIGSPRGLGGPLWLFGGLRALRKGSFSKDVCSVLRVFKMPPRRFTDEIVKITCVFNDFKR